MKTFLQKIIRWYQKSEKVRIELARNLFLPIDCCRFTPTCSQYMDCALEKYGTCKGLALGLWRILRCGPWSKGGYDPVK